jgi:2-iminobutanoate/2-iminopropanoate deaminase
MMEAVRTDRAPAAIGPYSQGMRCTGGLIFTAGQLGMDPASGSLVPGGIEPECRRALENLRAVLEAAGSSLAGVVKVTVFLADMREFPAMNAVYETFFRAPYPARSAFQVAALPKNGRIEIEAVATVE